MAKALTRDGMERVIQKKWLVEFNRKPLDKHPLFGFMLARNDEFTLIQEFDSSHFQLNGWIVFKNDSVKNFKVYDDQQYFLTEVVRFEKIRPRSVEISIDSWADILASAAEKFPLIVIERERIERDACYIGKLVETKNNGFVLWDIDPSAEWDKKRNYKYKDVTKIQFGGKYETVLASVNSKRESSDNK